MAAIKTGTAVEHFSFDDFYITTAFVAAVSCICFMDKLIDQRAFILGDQFQYFHRINKLNFEWRVTENNMVSVTVSIKVSYCSLDKKALSLF